MQTGGSSPCPASRGRSGLQCAGLMRNRRLRGAGGPRAEGRWRGRGTRPPRRGGRRGIVTTVTLHFQKLEKILDAHIPKRQDSLSPASLSIIPAQNVPPLPSEVSGCITSRRRFQPGRDACSRPGNRTPAPTEREQAACRSDGQLDSLLCAGAQTVPGRQMTAGEPQTRPHTWPEDRPAPRRLSPLPGNLVRRSGDSKLWTAVAVKGPRAAGLRGPSLPEPVCFAPPLDSSSQCG